jgi:hypothetical protein
MKETRQGIALAGPSRLPCAGWEDQQTLTVPTLAQPAAAGCDGHHEMSELRDFGSGWGQVWRRLPQWVETCTSMTLCGPVTCRAG